MKWRGWAAFSVQGTRELGLSEGGLLLLHHGDWEGEQGYLCLFTSPAEKYPKSPVRLREGFRFTCAGKGCKGKLGPGITQGNFTHSHDLTIYLHLTQNRSRAGHAELFLNASGVARHKGGVFLHSRPCILLSKPHYPTSFIRRLLSLHHGVLLIRQASPNCSHTRNSPSPCGGLDCIPQRTYPRDNQRYWPK